jgi:hypothetical protein
MSPAATTISSAPATRWPGLGYEQVPGLANRIISRYLRAQRRNMMRFFTERGLLDLAERMRRIRKSRQGMLAKNQMFQKVLNDYSERVTPKATPELDRRPIEHLGVPAEAARADIVGADNAGGVPEVARLDGAAGVVIEE